MAISSSAIKVFSDAQCQNLVGTFAGTTAASQTISITGLTSNTTYYLRAEATNSDSLTGYSSVQSFTTSSASYIFTGTVGYSSAYNYLDVDLQVSCAGCTFTRCGIEFATNSAFSGAVISDSNTTAPANDFVGEVGGFAEHTQYYYRYFAEGTYGRQTSIVYTITTLYDEPTLAITATNITDTSATLTYSYTGNYPVDTSNFSNMNATYGVSGGSNPTYIQFRDLDNGVPESFQLTGLTPNTTYYADWEVVLDEGETYERVLDQVITFTTLTATPVVTIGTINNITPTSAQVSITIS